MIDGFVGQYKLCIAMAEALTAREVANGTTQAAENAGVPWIEVVEGFVDSALSDPAKTLPAIPALARSGG